MSVDSSDITSWFTEQCELLPPGRLVVQPNISLLEIMNSLEIGNGTMDTGFKPQLKICDPSTPLSSDEICWIMDEMTAQEYKWWAGGTLCQTVFTALPYHNFNLPSPLRAYAIAYAKCIDLVYSELSKGHVNDGEDCWLDHYGLSINMADPVGNVIELLEQSSVCDPAVSERIQHRMSLLRFLSGYPAILTLPTTPADPTPAAESFFFDVSSRLRQCMPLPEPRLDTRKEVWRGLEEAYTDMQQIAWLREEEDWRLGLQGKAYRRQMLPIVRSLYKSAISPPRGVRSRLDTDQMLQRFLARHTSFQLDGFTPVDPRHMALWRDLTRGALSAMLTTPLLNRPRQRRSYMNLSHTWHERAMTAERLFPLLAPCLHAARLDCLLEAALASMDLGLIVEDERRMTWWWIHQICTSRLELGLVESWESTWAQAWLQVSAGMQLIIPFSSICVKRFNLRLKWALKVPSDGHVLRPDHESFLRSDRPVDEVQARGYFRRARSTLQVLANNLFHRPCVEYLRMVQELQQDLLDVRGSTNRWLST